MPQAGCHDQHSHFASLDKVVPRQADYTLNTIRLNHTQPTQAPTTYSDLAEGFVRDSEWLQHSDLQIPEQSSLHRFPCII